ncbi:MAG: hypothetical protein ACSHYF_06660 [Verrucomicrobiaceae bacterium]
MGSFFRFIKNLVITGLILAVITLVGGIIYLNQVGFPGQYGEWIRSELSKNGIEVQFESLHFSPRKGLVATKASFYRHPDDEMPALTADYLSIDIDKSLAIRGQFELREIIVTGGSTTVSTEDGEESIHARDVTAAVFIDSENRIRIRKATALIEGLKVQLEADLKLPSREIDHDEPRKAANVDRILRPILDELARWEIPADSPPEISFSVRGDLNKPEKIVTEFSLEANSLVRNEYSLGTLRINGDMRSQLVTIDRILLADDDGQAEGQADWDFTRKEGRFNLTSSLRLQHFLKSCFGIEVLTELKQESPPFLNFQGSLAQRDDNSFSVRVKGDAVLGPFQFLDGSYEGLESMFSWHDGDLFLLGLKVTHTKGSLTGELLIKGEDIRYKVRSTLPLDAFSPFIADESATEKIISRFKFGPQSIVAVDVKGHMKRNDLKDGIARGKMHSTGLTYRDISLHQLSADFEFTPEKIEFSRVNASLNDENENARRRYQGPASEPFRTDRIHIDRKTKITTVSNLRGTFWPTPVIRAFAPKTADNIERNYRFHNPPTLTLNGTFQGIKDRPQDTVFAITLRTTGQTDYPFLGRILPLKRLTADISMRGLDLAVDRLAFESLEGVAGGKVRVQVGIDDPTTYQGELQWDRISFPALSKVYQFKEVEEGTLAGKIRFSGGGNDIRNFNATGALGLQQGNLVSLPVLGPLSPIMAGILGNKQAGYERAKDASASFIVKNGVWQSNDIVAVSTSIVLTGDGWIDLKTNKMDMTIRVNARGLLGLIAIPLTPLKGLFQFRGTGDFTKPSWNSSPFTQPRKGKLDVIFSPPPKRTGNPNRR